MSDSEAEPRRLNGTAETAHVDIPMEPSTPQDSGIPESSQITLPSTEIPASPMDPTQSFKTEVNDDRPSAATVIPSSLTPPPSTQVELPNGNLRRGFSQSQQSNYFSPPLTVQPHMRDRDTTSDYAPPSTEQIADAPVEEVRAMLEACVVEHQKQKMMTAHYKLQNTFLGMQTDEEAQRAEVELDMLRREIEALRTAEHSRQAKRELSTFSEAIQTRYMESNALCEELMAENKSLERKLNNAKKIIQQKDEQNLALLDRNDELLNRIRENREHMNILCSPGGAFHGCLTQRQITNASSLETPRQSARGGNRDGEGNHGLSTLLEVLNRDDGSGPSTPIMHGRAGGRHGGKHHRNAQSMSSLPTTPIHRPLGPHAALLPSANLIPQTEPAQRFTYRQYEPPMTPTPKADRRRKSRESTISAEDNEELARQAMRSFSSRASFDGSQRRERSQTESEVYGSQASQAARELLLREPREPPESFNASRIAAPRDVSPHAAERSSKLQAQLFSNLRGGPEKRKYSGNHGSETGSFRTEQHSPPKRARASSAVEDRTGLGIQYGR